MDQQEAMKYEIQAPEGTTIPEGGIPIVNAEFGNTIGLYLPDGSIDAPAHVKYLLFHKFAFLEIENGRAVLKKSIS